MDNLLFTDSNLLILKDLKNNYQICKPIYHGPHSFLKIGDSPQMGHAQFLSKQKKTQYNFVSFPRKLRNLMLPITRSCPPQYYEPPLDFQTLQGPWVKLCLNIEGSRCPRMITRIFPDLPMNNGNRLITDPLPKWK